MTPERAVLRATIGSINSWIEDLQTLRVWTPGTRRNVGHLIAQMEAGRQSLEAVLGRDIERDEGRE